MLLRNSTLSYYVTKHSGSTLSLKNSLINALHAKVKMHFLISIIGDQDGDKSTKKK